MERPNNPAFSNVAINLPEAAPQPALPNNIPPIVIPAREDVVEDSPSPTSIALGLDSDLDIDSEDGLSKNSVDTEEEPPRASTVNVTTNGLFSRDRSRE